jgi:hypothetical protein
VSAVVAIPDVGPVGKLEVSAVVVISNVGLVGKLVVSGVVVAPNVVTLGKLVVSAVVVIRDVVAFVKPVVFCFVVISEIKIVEFLYVMAVSKDIVSTTDDRITYQFILTKFMSKLIEAVSDSLIGCSLGLLKLGGPC